MVQSYLFVWVFACTYYSTHLLFGYKLVLDKFEIGDLNIHQCFTHYLNFQIGFGLTNGSKPRMVRTSGVPFQTNPGDGSAIIGKDKIIEAKPSMVGMAYPFFRPGTPKSTGDSIISSITTEVGGAGIHIPRGTLQTCSYKYSSQYFLNPIDIALWLVPACVLGGHKLVSCNHSSARPFFQFK